MQHRSQEQERAPKRGRDVAGPVVVTGAASPRKDHHLAPVGETRSARLRRETRERTTPVLISSSSRSGAILRQLLEALEAGDVRGLTVQQPFASAIIDGPKRVENRKFDLVLSQATPDEAEPRDRQAPREWRDADAPVMTPPLPGEDRGHRDHTETPKTAHLAVPDVARAERLPHRWLLVHAGRNPSTIRMGGMMTRTLWHECPDDATLAEESGHVIGVARVVESVPLGEGFTLDDAWALPACTDKSKPTFCWRIDAVVRLRASRAVTPTGSPLGTAVASPSTSTPVMLLSASPPSTVTASDDEHPLSPTPSPPSSTPLGRDDPRGRRLSEDERGSSKCPVERGQLGLWIPVPETVAFIRAAVRAALRGRGPVQLCVS